MLRLASTLAALLVAANAHARPVVEKVDPPSWWVRHTWSPLQVLVTGQGFSGARVTSLGSGIEPAVRHVSDDGRYLFVYFDTAPTLRPGAHRFRIETASGAAEFELRFDPPVSRAGRFRSFTPDDVVYLLVPDRFSNGDPANDSPAELGAAADRSSPAAILGGSCSRRRSCSPRAASRTSTTATRLRSAVAAPAASRRGSTSRAASQAIESMLSRRKAAPATRRSSSMPCAGSWSSGAITRRCAGAA